MLKQFDKNGEEFAAASLGGVMLGASLVVTSHISYAACQKAWKKAGETRAMPDEIAKVFDAVEMHNAVINGLLNNRHQLAPPETIREEIDKVADALARKAITQYLASGVAA